MSMDQDWPHFKREELQCKFDPSQCSMNPEFMARIEELRVAWGKPLRVSSAFRSKQHPRERTKPNPGRHTAGEAIDFAIYGAEALDFLKLALELGFKGVGCHQRQEFDTRFIHLDHRLEIPAFWTY